MTILPSSVKRVTIVKAGATESRYISYKKRSGRRKWKGPVILRPAARVVERLGEAAEVAAVDFRRRVRRSRRDNGTALVVETPLMIARSTAKGLKRVRKLIPSTVRIFIPRIEF